MIHNAYFIILQAFNFQVSIFNFINIMEKAKVLETIKAAGEPINAGKVAELSGLDRKVVDKAMKQLKEEGEIISPKRCYWTAK